MAKKRSAIAYDFLIESAQAAARDGTDTCLIWPYQKDSDGYGRLRIPLAIAGKRIKVAAHRLSYKAVNGHWPEPMGLHSCDNPSCFNPLHIYEGSDQDNKDDQVRRNRTTQGNAQRDAKLTDETVVKIRLEYADGHLSFKKLAQKYGVSEPTATAAITGKTWKHVPGKVSSIKRVHILQSTCNKGHLFTPENTYSYASGKRYCKKCTLIRGGLRRQAKRGI